MLGLALFSTLASAQSWTTLTNKPPAGITNCLLLTDATVMCQSGASFYKLTPNNTGSYASGTWSTLASLPSGYNPDAYASMVLQTGKAVIIGGEYNNGSFALSDLGAVYDPVANTWTTLAPPPAVGNPNQWQCIGDAPATILSTGGFLVGSKLYQNLAVLDPNALTWTELTVSGKEDKFNSEEGWTLLPDGSVFTVDVANAPDAERLFVNVPSATGAWYSAGTTPQDLHTPTTSSPLTAPGCPVYDPPGEMGPQMLLPNGNVFAIGADGKTAVYTPPAAGSTATGTWVEGPAMPSGLNVEDGPAALLPSGNVLFGASPGDSGTGLKYFEFNGTSLVSVPAPSRASSDATYYTSLLVLPTGQVMFIDGSTTVQLYNSTGSPSASWAPSITNVPTTISNSVTYQINGTQFNGLSQANSFGDESQDPTNYPLVRITNGSTGHVFYARTHDHSTMGVATGSAVVFTNFDVPATIEGGTSTIQVVANGIASAPVTITVNSTTPPTITSITPKSGPVAGGTTVTIAGTNFQSGLTVTFGGVVATINSVTATSIGVTSPAASAAGPVNVVVTNPSSSSATLANGFTYLGPAPTVTGISPTSGTASGGTATTISGSNFVSGVTVTFGGTAGTVTAVTATSISVTTPAHSAGAVSVVVTNPDGQSATLTNAYTYTGTSPTITRVSPTSGTRRGGTTVTITGTNFLSGAKVTFGGISATVSSVSGTSIVVRTPAHAAGSVNVVVTNTGGLSATLTNGYTYTNGGLR